MKNKAFNVLIVLALFLGAVSIFLIKKFVEVEKGKVQTIVQAVEAKVEMAKVLVATNDIPPAKPFDPLSFKVVDIPKELLPETALTQPSELDGKLSAFFIPKGDMILRAKAVLPNELPRASFMIAPGRRIISIPINEIVTSGFVIRNGDYVDLVGNFQVPRDFLAPQQELFGEIIAVTFMQRVKVVDIFKGEVQITGETEADGKKGSMGNQGKRLGEGTIATFDVTPLEAELIMGALRASQGINLVLRGYDDKEKRPILNPMHLKILSGLNQEIGKTVVQETPPSVNPTPVRRPVL